MVEQDYFRAGLIIHYDSRQATNKYIIEFTKIAIYKSSKKYLNVSEIKNFIFSTTQLEYTEEEISDILEEAQTELFCNNDNYSIYPAELENIKNKLESPSVIEENIKKFISVHEIPVINEYIEDLIFKFLFHLFNTNREALNQLIGNRLSNGININDFNATNEDKDIINLFLDWKDESKYDLIDNIISYCFDFCMLSAKMDKDDFGTIFKERKFFLDTNIIFRLVGFNGVERKNVISRFIEKSKDVKIKMLYTNFTLEEIYRVIDDNVMRIKTFNNNSYPMNPHVIERITGCGETDEIDIIYYNWCKDGHNKHDNYTKFSDFLKKKIITIVGDFKYKTNESYEITKQKEFESLSTSLKNYKTSKNKSFNNSSIQTDVNNTIYLLNIRENANITNFIDTKDYIVSTDRAYCDWSRKVSPGVPLIVLPSLWLSIILKFSGRSSDDIGAFCSFMHLRKTANPDQEAKLGELIKEINKKTNDTDIKEQIIINLCDTKNIYDLNIEEEVTNSYEQIVNKKIEISEEKHKKEHEENLKDFDEKIQKMNKEYDARIDEISTSHKNDLNKSKKIVEEDTTQKTINDFANDIVENKINFWIKLKNENIIVKGACTILVIFILGFICLRNIDGIYDLLHNIKITKDKEFEAIIFINTALSLLITILIFIYINIMSNFSRKERLKNKYMRMHIKK